MSTLLAVNASLHNLKFSVKPAHWDLKSEKENAIITKKLRPQRKEATKCLEKKQQKNMQRP